MIGVTKVISTSFDAAKRLIVKVLFQGKLIRGKGDVRTPLEASPFGIDSNPVEGKVALYARSGKDGKYYVFAYLNTERLAEPGETRLFSTDENGVLQTFILLKNAGNTMHLGGDVNWAVKYTEAKAEADKLKATVNDLVSKWNAFCTSYIPGGPAVQGTPPSLAASNVTANASDFSLMKNEKIKTI